MYMPKQHDTTGLHARNGEKIALQSVNIDVSFNNLLCETLVSQVYKNLEQVPIEAVYTFPLTSQAVLLGLKVVIGGRELQGVVVEKTSAEAQYEEAITNGDAAIMLEQVQLGLYTMNVGNMKAGEEVRVTIRHVELYTWQNNNLRFHLPTTIAPRYGNPESTGMQPHQTPEYDLLVENRFRLALRLVGVLARAQLTCPSHKITVDDSKEITVVTLAAREASMDRDFILNISEPEAAKNFVLTDRDYDGGFVALASFVPKFPSQEKIPPKSIKIVVDCSGSMNGDSIAQARQAISNILDHLRPEDFFNIIPFGSTCKTYFDRQVLATKKNIAVVQRLLRSLDADMGGTEMRQALQTVVQLPGPSMPQDILLITDGEIWEGDEIIKEMIASKHRVFTIGVGSSVSEGFVRQLAKETNGACELVVPGEKMAEKIVRHFKRIFLPRAEGVKISWPEVPAQIIPSDLGPVYDGDTINVFALLNEDLQGPVSLELTHADGQVVSITVNREITGNLASNDDSISCLARIARFKALEDMDEKQATATATRYQLISRYTNYLVVNKLAEEEKSNGLPHLRKVPQMVAAGWGGGGSIQYSSTSKISPCLADGPSEASRYLRDEHIKCASSASRKLERKNHNQRVTPEVFITRCNQLNSGWSNFISKSNIQTPYHDKKLFAAFLENIGDEFEFSLYQSNGGFITDIELILRIKSFTDLRIINLPERVVKVIKKINEQVNLGVTEEVLVLIFLIALVNSPVGGIFERDTKRVIKKAQSTLKPDEKMIDLMTKTFSGISRDDWGIRKVDIPR